VFFGGIVFFADKNAAASCDAAAWSILYCPDGMFRRFRLCMEYSDRRFCWLFLQMISLKER